MIEKIKQLSRKNIVLVLSIVAFAWNEYNGNPIDREGMYTLLGFVASWLVARGIADHGAGGSVRNADEIYQKGKQIVDMLKKNGGKPVVVSPTPIEGPKSDHPTE